VNITTGIMAKLFNRSKQTIINWCDKSLLMYHRVDNGPRSYVPGEILHFIEEQGIKTQTLNHGLYRRIFNVTGIAEECSVSLRVDKTYIDHKGDPVTIVGKHESWSGDIIEHFIDNHGKWFSKNGTLINYQHIEGGSSLCLKEMATIQERDEYLKGRTSQGF